MDRRAAPAGVAALFAAALGIAAGGNALAGRGGWLPACLGASLLLISLLIGARRARLCLWIAAALALGVGAGTARTATIDAGALGAGAGDRAELVAFVTAEPWRSSDLLAYPARSEGGRLAIELPKERARPQIGAELEVRGRFREIGDWERPRLERIGIRAVLVARRAEPTGSRRGGLPGAIDAVRARAERALSEGLPRSGSQLLRGFVLGQQSLIDESVAESFRRSGLAHLLAVSGTNVMLLVLLATAVLAILGVPLMPRLATVALIVLIYVPVAGAGPSIQRAGVMGLAGLAALAAARPLTRSYALALAAAVTLLLDPRAVADVGWQLSFAAVAGIAIAARPLAELIVSRGSPAEPLRRTLADGVGLTVAASVATAPLMALHFERLSVTTLAANLLALPAVAPVMWLGMTAAFVGQVWGDAARVVALPGAFVAGWIGQASAWLGDAEWTVVPAVLSGAHAALIAVGVAAAAAIFRTRATARRGLDRRPLSRRAAGARRSAAVAMVALIIAWASVEAPWHQAGSGAELREPGPALVLRFLDVGQGDAILIEPPRGEPLLVDAGPPWARIDAQLARHGIASLGSLVLTHADEDHAGGAGSLIASGLARQLILGEPAPALARRMRRAGGRVVRVARGDVLRGGGVRLEVLWPPPPTAPASASRSAAAADPNDRSIVLRLSWRRFTALLTGDAEAESVPIDPGPVDLLKVSHHGSEDAGLERLLARSAPRLAVLQVGEGNSYGHPHPQTLATLERAGVALLRTDRDGEVRVEADAAGAVRVHAGG